MLVKDKPRSPWRKPNTVKVLQQAPIGDASVRAYPGLPYDGDVSVADQPPGGVVELRLKAKLLQKQETDAGNCEQTHQGEGHKQGEQGDV